MLLKPLAYKDPGRLYAASESAPKLARVYPSLPVNASHFRSWQEQCRSCESAALLNPASFNLTARGEPEVVEGATCTWPLFHVLGVEPQLGRTFEESDDQPGANKFVVVSDSLWRRRLGADPGVIGKPIQIDGEPHVVVGVLRADFRFPSGEQSRAIESISQTRGDLQADGVQLGKAGPARPVQFCFRDPAAAWRKSGKSRGGDDGRHRRRGA